MNYKALFQKLYVAIFLLLTVVVHLAEPIEVQAVTGDASGTADGSVTSFGFNNETSITSLRITETSGVDINSGLDPADLSRSM